MATQYVFSTLATDVEYVDWIPGGGEVPSKGRSVVVKGGAGVADKRLLTPLGISTKITDEDASFLETNKTFKAHEKAGHVKLSKRDMAPEKFAADMTGRDKSAPLVPGDYRKRNDGDMDAPTHGDLH